MKQSIPDREALITRMKSVAALLDAGLVVYAASGEPLAAALPQQMAVPPQSSARGLITCEIPGPQGAKGAATLVLLALDPAARERIAGSRAQCQIWLRQLAAELAPLVAPSLAEGDWPITFRDLYGTDPKHVAVRELAMRVAPTESTVLIRGESGTGKELFARAIHAESHLRHGPFVAINCAAIPEPLLESELFGYEDGAFTGAKRGGKPGRLELAAGGTLFLDEVGDLPLPLQAKLLRVLQFREVERVGGVRTVSLDFRVLAATNRPLADLVRQNTFREDLYYRLNVISLTIPPLRDRKDDLVMLLEMFTKRSCLRLHLEPKRWSAEALAAALRYHWPGNVRELQNVVERAVVLQQGDLIAAESLPPELVAAVPPGVPWPGSPSLPSRTARESGPTAEPGRWGPGPTAAAVRGVVARYSNTAAGREAAARELGISRATLYRRIRELRLE